MTDLLFEIGTEEIPAGYITPALNQIKTLFGERFKYFRLTFQSIYCTGTPRRLGSFYQRPAGRTGKRHRRNTRPFCCNCL
ncbi:glycine--tRNA ligase subunit beta [Candidatus Kuenenia stuttgartensis]|uniref:glycine--tRNA ligase subunit beta n=1 Tax=Kuenenia stuttgartiensis TaxID=174633 RepID=UPI00146E8F49